MSSEGREAEEEPPERAQPAAGVSEEDEGFPTQASGEDIEAAALDEDAGPPEPGGP